MRIARSPWWLVLAILAAAPSALATQRKSEGSNARKLDGEVVELLAQHQARPTASTQARASELLAERKAALLSLIASDPAEALRVAFDEKLLRQLASAFPGAAGLLEKRSTVSGEMEVLVADAPDLSSASVTRRLVTTSGDLDLSFAAAPSDLQSGETVTLQGVTLGGAMAVSKTSSQRRVSSCSTTGSQNIAVLLVKFPGQDTPFVTPAEIWDVFFAQSGLSLDGYWREVSNGKASATGDVFGWYTLGATYSCDQAEAMQTAAIQAADHDVDFRRYTRVVILFPPAGPCNWSGLSTVGCRTLSSADGTFSASTSWILSGYFASRDAAVRLVTHEAGHALGLNHASSRSFGAEAVGALARLGTLEEYGDRFSAMGSWNYAHYAAPHKELLGWQPSGSAVPVSANGSYTIQPSEAPGLNALKVKRGTCDDGWLWLEYRQAQGYDGAVPPQVYGGALVHLADSLSSTYTHLLDFTPGSRSQDDFVDPALLAGGTWSDPYTNLSLAVDRAAPNGLDVRVSYGAAVCTPAMPTVSLGAQNPSVLDGASATYPVTVTSNDGCTCPAATFTFASTEPQGWLSTFSPASVSLAPGQSATVTMSVAVPPGTVPGTRTVDAVATHGGISGTGFAAVTVLARLTASASASSAIVSGAGTVTFAGTIRLGGLPVQGAAVTFSLTRPDGTSTSKSATTDASGAALWSYRMNRREPAGTYLVSVAVSAAGQSTTSTPASFTYLP